MNTRYLSAIILLCTAATSVSAQPASTRIPHTEVRVPGLDLNTNRVNILHRRYPSLDGQGLTVSIKENQYDTTDIDLRLRHRPSDRGAGFTASHASLMATIIGGAGNSYYTGRGVARAVTLTTADFLNLWPDGKAHYQSMGISVQNHSYGVGLENYYGADAAAYDASVRELPYLVHVFSSGNQGTTVSEKGPYAGVEGYANLTGSFKMAKNILTVGAVEKDLHINRQISRGPAYDGRLKPDLTAAGQDGSSGAAALVSGVSLLLQQAYQAKTTALPPSALVQSLLLNSAEDIGPPGIDYQSGFGNLNAWRAVETLHAQQFHLGSLANTEQDSLVITLPKGVHEFKITLSWTDPPADSLVPRALVNDLDLELFYPATGHTWRPWILSTFPHADSLAQPARRGRDPINNHEQISLINPAAGEYLLRIRGYDVPQGPQAFALAYAWDTLDSFEWTYPAAGDYLEAGEIANLRWNTTLADSPAFLEYTLDEGNSWSILTDTLHLADEGWRWELPDTFALAQLRLRTQKATFLSTPFYIYRGLRLRVGYNCEESVFLYWNRVEPVTTYVVYGMEERYLQPIAIVRDTFFQLEKASSSDVYYAVGPQIGDAPENLRGPTINYNFQGVGCYFKTFFASLDDGPQARLQVELGTLFGIRAIVFEKSLDGQFVAIGSLSPGMQTQYGFFDPDLREGLTAYRARLDLQNGETLYSNEDFIYYVPAEQYRIFPNPVIAGESLQVVSGTIDEAERVFYLFDNLGRQVGLLPLGLPFENMELQHLPEGIYLYQIRKDGRQQQTGKVVVVRE